MELGIGNFLEKILTIDYLHSESSTLPGPPTQKQRIEHYPEAKVSPVHK